MVKRVYYKELEITSSSPLTPQTFIAPLLLGRGVSTDTLGPQGRVFSLDTVVEGVEHLVQHGIETVCLFTVGEKRTADAVHSLFSRALIPECTRLLRKNFPSLEIITDLCLCSFTADAHCVLYSGDSIDYAATFSKIVPQAIIHAEAGSNMLMPSVPIPDLVPAIREELDSRGFQSVKIFPQSAKFDSALYGAFRTVSHTDIGIQKSAYQLDPADKTGALKRFQDDLRCGASGLVVKPSFGYLDILSELRSTTARPLYAFMTSGEYAFYADEDSKSQLTELLHAIQRAGADKIITHAAWELPNIISPKASRAE